MIQSKHKLEGIIKEFSTNQLEVLFQNMGALQLTDGCSGACPDCGLQAKPGVTDIITFEFLDKIFTDFKKHIKGFIPYFASDPFDYDDGQHTYFDVHKLIEERLHINPTVITNIPRKKEKDIWEYIFSGNKAFGIVDSTSSNLINAVSMTDLNANRILRHLRELVPQIDEPQLIVPSKYALRKCINATSITKEGFLRGTEWRWVLQNTNEVLKTLRETNSNNIYINGNNAQAQIKRQVRMVSKPKGWMTTFEYRMKYDRTPTKQENEEIWARSRAYHKRIDDIVPRQISLETGIGVKGNGKIYFIQLPNGHYLGREGKTVQLDDVLEYFEFQYYRTLWKTHQPFFGVDIRDDRGEGMHSKALGFENLDNLSESGIGCFHGVVLTPEGFFNHQTRKPTKQYPYGYKLEHITPEHFRVAKHKWVSGTNSLHVAKGFRYIS